MHRDRLVTLGIKLLVHSCDWCWNMGDRLNLSAKRFKANLISGVAIAKTITQYRKKCLKAN
jgi:hypothetical protein